MSKSNMWNTVVGVILGSQLEYKDKRELIDFVRQVEADQEAREDPQPLTIEELRQMYKNPVYAVPMRPAPGEKGEWCIIGLDRAHIPEKGWIWPISDYGATWIAYRHKPKEDKK